MLCASVSDCKYLTFLDRLDKAVALEVCSLLSGVNISVTRRVTRIVLCSAVPMGSFGKCSTTGNSSCQL